MPGYCADLTKEEIRRYLDIYNDISRSPERELASGSSKEEIILQKSERIFFGHCLRLSAVIAAGRMYKNDRSVPLVSKRELDDLVPVLIRADIFESSVFRGLDAESKSDACAGMLAFLNPIFDAIAKEAAMPTAYDDEWKKIHVLREICKERNCSPEELIATPGIRDEIIRHSYADADAYRREMRKTVDAIGSLDELRETLYRQLAMKMNKEEGALRSELRALVEAEVDEMCRNIAAEQEQGIEKEISRIWP